MLWHCFMPADRNHSLSRRERPSWMPALIAMTVRLQYWDLIVVVRQARSQRCRFIDAVQSNETRNCVLPHQRDECRCHIDGARQDTGGLCKP